MRVCLMEQGRFWVDEVPDPEPGPGEVLVKSVACGICGSDLHAAAHTREFVATSREAGGAFKLLTLDPVVLGHEFCAEVVEYGPPAGKGTARGKRLNSGDLVCSVPALVRERTIPLGYSTEAPGGFSEYMLLSERLLVEVPEGIAAEAAALTEPMAVGYHAVNKSRLEGGEAVLVIGCGPVGLAVITALNARGIGPIVGVDPSPPRREFALAQGAHAVFDPATEDAYAYGDLRRSEDVVIFECVGVPGMIDEIFLKSPANARIVVVGVCLQMDHSRPLIAVNKELNVQYVLGYSVSEFAESLSQIADGRFDVAGLVTDRVGLEGVGDAFQRLRNPEDAKILVRPWQ